MAQITSITNPSSSTSTGSTITAPSDLQMGDLLLIFDCASTSGAPPSSVQPSGFTAVSEQSGSSMTDAMWYKIADGSEASQTFTGMNGVFSDRKLFLVFRANIPIISATLSTVSKTITGSNPGSQTISASGGTAPLLVIASWADQDTSNDISPRTQSPSMTEVSNSTHQYIGWIPYYSSPSDQTFDMDDEGFDNALMGWYFTLKGAQGQFFSVF